MADYRRENFSEEYRILTALVKQGLFGIESHYPAQVDAQALQKEMKQQAVQGFLGIAAENLNISEEEKKDFRIAASMMEFSFLKICIATNTLVETMRAEGVPFVILKGFAAAQYYPDPILRSMGDVDFLVMPDDFERAETALIKSGFKKTGEATYRHSTFIFEDVPFEMHRQFAVEKNGDGAEYVDRRIYEALPNAVNIRFPQIELPVLPDAVNGLVLLSHLRNHIAGGIGMRHILDWVIFVDRVLDDDFWEREFREAAETTGLAQLAAITARMGQLYLGLTEENRTWCLNAGDDNAVLLAEYVFDCGNFGRKTGAGLGELMYATKQTGGFFKSLQYKGLNSGWKAMEKHPFLRHFAWLHQGISFLKKRIRNGTLISSLTGGVRNYKRFEKMLEAFNVPAESADEND